MTHRPSVGICRDLDSVVPADDPQRAIPSRLRFGRWCRLSLDRDYRAVFDARLRKSAGPITLWARPNQLDHPRLGLSIGRRVGNAVTRNRLKRRLREAFRIEQARLPRTDQGSYDLVLSARGHSPLTLDQYREIVLDLAHRCHRTNLKRARSRASQDPHCPTDPATSPGVIDRPAEDVQT